MLVPFAKGPPRGAFTLIELIIVVVVLGIVAALGTGVIVEAGRAYTRAKTTTDALADAQYALDRLSLELRNLSSPTDITAMGSQAITFTVWGSSRAYGKSGTNLRINGKDIATNVSAFNLVYYQADGNLATTSAQVNRVAAEIAIARNGRTVSLRTEAFPRSFRNSYVSWQEQ